MKKILALVAATMLASPAMAAFTFTPGATNTSGTVIASFNDSADDNRVKGSKFLFQSNTNADGALPAFGDQSRYLSVTNGGKAAIDFGDGITSFTLDVGSLDTYNSLSVHYRGGRADTFTGSDFTANANGDQASALTNGLLTWTGNREISRLTFTSSGNSFEVDNLRVAAVPEPATWATMIAGFALAGAAARKRRPTLRLA